MCMKKHTIVASVTITNDTRTVKSWRTLPCNRVTRPAEESADVLDLPVSDKVDAENNVTVSDSLDAPF
jgi:hypothetical protein